MLLKPRSTDLGSALAIPVARGSSARSLACEGPLLKKGLMLGGDRHSEFQCAICGNGLCRELLTAAKTSQWVSWPS